MCEYSFTTHSKGELDLISPNTSIENRQNNRRVSIQIQGDK